MEWVFKRQCLTSRSSDVSNLNSDAFLDCLLNYASAASGAVKKTKKPKNQKTPASHSCSETCSNGDSWVHSLETEIRL